MFHYTGGRNECILNAFICGFVASVFGTKLLVIKAFARQTIRIDRKIECKSRVFERILGKNHIGTMLAID